MTAYRVVPSGPRLGDVLLWGGVFAAGVVVLHYIVRPKVIVAPVQQVKP